MALVWTQERKEELRRLAGRGMSAEQIALYINESTGPRQSRRVITRNAVIGAAHRYKVALTYSPPGQARRGEGRKNTMSERRRNKSKSGRSMGGAKAVRPKSTVMASLHRSFVKGGSRQCMWHGCEESSSGAGKPYCTRHAEMARRGEHHTLIMKKAV